MSVYTGTYALYIYIGAGCLHIFLVQHNAASFPFFLLDGPGGWPRREWLDTTCELIGAPLGTLYCWVLLSVLPWLINLI